jgi:hypothetical protein
MHKKIIRNIKKTDKFIYIQKHKYKRFSIFQRLFDSYTCRLQRISNSKVMITLTLMISQVKMKKKSL